MVTDRIKNATVPDGRKASAFCLDLFAYFQKEAVMS